MHAPFPASNESNADRRNIPPMPQKVAFITGGNRGLGYQTALELGRADIKVVIGSRSLVHGEQALAKLRAADVKADVLLFDITRTASHSDRKSTRLNSSHLGISYA